MTIDDTTFALIDTEATRKEADHPQQEVIEVAVHLYRGTGQFIDRYASLVFPLGEVPPESSGIHHLTIDDLIGAPSAEDVAARLYGMIPPDAVAVAHNAEYDRVSLRRMAPWLADDNRWLCTERLAHHVVPKAPDFKLQTLRYYFGKSKIDLGGLDPHRADADVAVLERVFFTLIANYRAFAEQECAGDVERLAKSEQIETLLKYVASPYSILTWPMGPAEAKGLPLEKVEIGLLKWALKKDLKPDLRWNIEREMQRRRAA